MSRAKEIDEIKTIKEAKALMEALEVETDRLRAELKVETDRLNAAIADRALKDA